jgi:hypothetical protein
VPLFSQTSTRGVQVYLFRQINRRRRRDRRALVPAVAFDQFRLVAVAEDPGGIRMSADFLLLGSLRRKSRPSRFIPAKAGRG